MDILSEMFGEMFGQISDIIGKYTTALLIVTIVGGILQYIFQATLLKEIGIKVGLDLHWRAFVPIANTIYRLEIAGFPWWYMFFYGVSGMCFASILGYIVSMVDGTFGIILAAIYAVNVFVTTIRYKIKYYQIFSINSILVIADYIPVFRILPTVVDIMLGFTHVMDQYIPGYQPVNSQAAVNVVPPLISNSEKVGSIVGTAGEYNGASFKMQDGQVLVFGRDSAQCNVVFGGADSVSISHRHCAVRYYAQENRYVITDYSKNGTFDAQGNKLPANATMYSGDLFYLADRRNMFRLG